MSYYQQMDKAHITKERLKAKALRQSNWWKVKENICYYCGLKFERKDLTMDHKVPIARGGKSTKSNVVLSCKKCNTLKGTRTMAEIIIDLVDS